MKYIKSFEDKYDKLIEAEFREELLDSITWGKSNLDELLEVGKKKYYTLDFDEINYHNYYNNPLILAVYLSRLNFIFKLIKYGLNINVQSKTDGKTSLHIAGENNNWDIIQCLLYNGADLTIKDTEGNYAVDFIIDEYQEWIKEDYPEQWNDYLIKKESEKYNL